MSIASFSIKQKVLVNLITIAIIVFGLFSVSTMQREGFPNITTDYAIINTLYPNASPEDVEDLITIPIEEKIGALDGIETYASISRESFSTIIIEMEADADNKDTILNNIIREADKAQLPADAEDPVVNNIKPEMPLLEISFSGQISKEKMIREHVKELENILKNIEGVASVTKVGWREREISIEIKPENLDKYYVSLPQIINSIKNSNISLPGGKFESDSKEMILRTMGEVKTPRILEIL
jgi:HAE1 family hydrophobic/amphiphilic exporter-1